jgi:farnesyl-diphosphate farnesyltransferase
MGAAIRQTASNCDDNSNTVIDFGDASLVTNTPETPLTPLQICIFYVVLRALDTIEDDMTLPNSVKLPLLRSLHLKLHEPGWNFDGSGPNEKDRQVLVEFDVVQAEFALLDPK